MRQINRIVLHHSASPRDTTTALQIRRWHFDRGFNDIGYHYVIEGSGKVVKGRDDNVVGAHCKGFNADSIGICLTGDFFTNGGEAATQEQLASLGALLLSLSNTYPEATLYTHKELGSTECPGNLREQLDVFLQADTQQHIARRLVKARLIALK